MSSHHSENSPPPLCHRFQAFSLRHLCVPVPKCPQLALGDFWVAVLETVPCRTQTAENISTCVYSAFTLSHLFWL